MRELESKVRDLEHKLLETKDLEQKLLETRMLYTTTIDEYDIVSHSSSLKWQCSAQHTVNFVPYPPVSNCDILCCAAWTDP